VAELHLGPLDRDVEASARLDLARRERLTRADDDGVRGRIAAKGVERPGARKGEPTALAGSEAPEAGVTAELPSGLVDERSLGCDEAVPLEEVAVVAAGEEAGLLTLGAARHGKPGALGFDARLLL